MRNIHIKQSPNAIKIYGDLFFGIYVIFGKKNQCKMVHKVAARHQGGTTPLGVLMACEHLERKTEEHTERDPISEGISPLCSHGDHGPVGELSFHLGGRPRKKKEKKEGGSLPLSRWHRNAAGATIETAIYTNNFAAIITNSPPLYAAV